MKWTTVLRSDGSQSEILFGNHGRCILQVKEERDHPACYQLSSKASIWDGTGCISAHGMGSLNIWKEALMLNDIFRFWSNICCHPDNVSFREGLVYFSRTTSNHILHVFQQHGSLVEESSDKLASCSPDLSIIENIWSIRT